MTRTRHLDFVPAAVEVSERPPAAGSRMFAAAIAGAVVLTAAWAWLTWVDVVAVASGRVVPRGHVKVVQPLELGVVRAIHVRDGEAVRAGQVLVELDPTTSGADRERLLRVLTAARLDVARLAVLARVPRDPARFAPPAGADAVLVGQQRALLAVQLGEHEARLAALAGDLARRRADHAAVGAQVTKLERTIPLVRDRADSYGVLAREGFVARLAHVELEQTLIEHEQELAAQRHRRDEAAAQVAALAEQRRQVEAEFHRAALAQLADAQTRAAGLAQDLTKSDARHGLRRLIAPIDGVVQQLAIHTVGGVVTPAQPLLVVVPSAGGIEVEALVLNRDVGFVRAGQAAEVKVETFPFTRYGTVAGTVVHVAADAVAQERAGLVYPARVALAQRWLEVDGRRAPLVPGMAVTVEIRTGERRVLDYVLSPLLRHAREGLRER